MERETVSEKPVLELLIDSGRLDCSVYASQLHGRQSGDVIVEDCISSMLGSETVIVSVAHRTEKAVVLLVEQRGWTENYGQIERHHTARLVPVELMA